MALRLSIYVFILIFNVIFVFVGLLSSSLEEFTKKEKRNQQKTNNKKQKTKRAILEKIFQRAKSLRLQNISEKYSERFLLEMT